MAYKIRGLSTRRRIKGISGVSRTSKFETSAELSLGRSLPRRANLSSVELAYSSPRSASFEVYPGE